MPGLFGEPEDYVDIDEQRRQQAKPKRKWTKKIPWVQIIFGILIIVSSAVFVGLSWTIYNDEASHKYYETELTICVVGDGVVNLYKEGWKHGDMYLDESVSPDSCESYWFKKADMYIEIKAFPSLGHTFVYFEFDSFVHTSDTIVGAVGATKTITAYFE